MDTENKATADDDLNASIVHEILEVGTDDPLGIILVTYLGAAYHAAVFGGIRSFLMPFEERIYEMLKEDPVSASIRSPDLKVFDRVGHQMELIYRVAIFDSFLNSLTSFALAMRPGKAIGNAQMPAGQLLSKTRSALVNKYIARRAKALSREDFITRIHALRDVMEIKLPLQKDNLRRLKQVSDMRNTIVHEGTVFQFSVDENLEISPSLGQKTVKIPKEQKFKFINHLVAEIYEGCVNKFMDRDLNKLEKIVIKVLRPKA